MTLRLSGRVAQHQIQRVTGANPEEGYIVVVRTARRSPPPRFSRRVASVVSILRSAQRSSASSTTPTPGTEHDLEQRDLTTVVATVVPSTSRSGYRLQKSIAASRR